MPIMANLRIALVSCLVLTAAASLARSSSSSRTSIARSALARTSIREGLNTMVLRAREWLRTHEDPDEAGMEELKSTNPDAYAIVQALITKKSLGLLNPKHPNAFGGYQEAPGKGVMSTQVVDPQPEAPVAALATQTQQTSHADFFNWKPHEDDDAMVSNLVGAVASIKNDAPVSSVEEAVSAPVKSVPAEPKVAALESSNSYLKSTGPMVKSPTASMSQSNSYLSSAGLEPKHFAVSNAHGNALQSFSWNDDDSAPASTPVAAQPRIPGGNALTNFLR
eukprot:gnl/MRDRNA2_/MRDRNA2_83304_c0_seq1.p1 gnl/MRDRNA2_/MRDRNA2_83304_c0~~gnl/MRDRNA2_/MRDRNA2_83304_c0_seq1.p1  ORF type:complete len:279 (+),score=70.72 gnl/MRDRNA2_/MRDRNA2_83304_c0_seq1:77-913(+)